MRKIKNIIIFLVLLSHTAICCTCKKPIGGNTDKKTPQNSSTNPSKSSSSDSPPPTSTTPSLEANEAKTTDEHLPTLTSTPPTDQPEAPALSGKSQSTEADTNQGNTNSGPKKLHTLVDNTGSGLGGTYDEEGYKKKMEELKKLGTIEKIGNVIYIHTVEDDEYIYRTKYVSEEPVEEEVHEETRPVWSIKHTFIPKRREGIIPFIQKNDIQTLQEDLAADSPNMPLIIEQIKDIYETVKEQKKEVKTLYRVLKQKTTHRRGDRLVLEQAFDRVEWPEQAKFEKQATDVRNYIEDPLEAQQMLAQIQENKEKAQKAYWEKEQAHIHKSINYTKRAKKVLKTLPELENNLAAVLQEKGLNLYDYVEPTYESDYENNYTSQELTDYLYNCGIDIMAIPDPSPQQEKEQTLVKSLSDQFTEQFSKLMQQIGQPNPMTQEDCLQLLETIPGLKQTVQSHYAELYQTSAPNYTHLTAIILHTILQSTSLPIGKTIQINNMNDVKKRIHRLEGAIQAMLSDISQTN